MKALLLHRPGDDYALTLADVPTPIPGPGEVRLRVRASSINPVDHKFARSGAGLALPHVLGIDAAGEIDALGPEVQGWRLGDRVMALTNLYRWGGFAEQVIVDARVLSRLPDALSFERAAAIPCAGLTAWQAVHLKLNLRPGQTVLVSGAGGGVGGYVVQMAQQRGARVIGTTARSGGWLWVPGTHLATEQGIHEMPGAAKAYLKDQGGTHYGEARVDAFLANGPKAIEFFTSKTCLQFDMPPVFPDYHAEAPGGTAGGRSMVTRPFDARQLGDKVKTLAPPVPELTVFGMMLGSGKELWHFFRAFKSVESFLYVAKRFGLHFLDVLRHGRGMTLTNGNALAGRLAKAGMDLGIPVWLNSPAKKFPLHSMILSKQDESVN